MNQPPNILFLMTDQQRWDTLGCGGNSSISTPNLDALAASGTRFTHSLTPTPICVAARMSLITGHRAATTRWVANNCLPGPLPELPTIMTLLQRGGYWTQGVGKMHFSGRHYGFRNLSTMEEGTEYLSLIDDDYRRYLLENKVRTRFPQGIRDLLYFQPQTCDIPIEHSQNQWVADRAMAFLREHRRYRGAQPFFLWASWIAPHPPFAPCAPFASRYDPAGLSLPINAERPLESLPSTLWSSRGRLDGAHRDPDRMRRIKALYYGQISHVDEALGLVLDELEALGLASDTVVFFVSDHGEMMGDQGLSQKNCPYEASVRVPLLLRWPGRTRPGQVCDDLVGLTDVLPTLVDQLDLPYPEDLCGPLPGLSLLGAEGGGLAHEREAYFSDYGSGRSRWISLRTQRYKYALYAVDGGLEELFDLEEDPHELDNIAAKRPDLSAEFRSRVLEWERGNGLAGSFVDGEFRTFPRPDSVPSEEECRQVMVNEGPAPKRLPPEDEGRLETFAEAFTRAIRHERTLAPEKLSLAQYREKIQQQGPRDPGGESLCGTPWEEAYLNA